MEKSKEKVMSDGVDASLWLLSVELELRSYFRDCGLSAFEADLQTFAAVQKLAGTIREYERLWNVRKETYADNPIPMRQV